MSHPILQFGTSRFLQAHVDLFISEALERGEALGGVAVVQTTASASSRRRIAALVEGNGYPVRIRGLRNGVSIDETVQGRAVRAAWHADAQWPLIRNAVANDVKVIVSNTGDQGYVLDPRDDEDGAALFLDGARTPHSFPAKLVVLLHDRWERQPGLSLSLYPCELVARNGDVLRDIVVSVAEQWGCPPEFVSYVRERCIWANSLVDRIVSEAIDPIGAVAEPYALWAIEARAGLVLPCTHSAIVVTDDLDRYAQLKLYLLNLGHTYLAERWLRDSRPADETVAQAMSDNALREDLEAVWRDEVLPVFDALGRGAEAQAYLAAVRDRFSNPFLAHRLSDIATHHAEKKTRRFGPVVALAKQHAPDLAQTRLRSALAAGEA